MEIKKIQQYSNSVLNLTTKLQISLQKLYTKRL